MRSWIERHQVLSVALGGGFVFVAWQLRDVLMVLFIGYLLAAALRPAVDWLVSWSVPRVVAIVGLYLVFFAGLAWLLGSALSPLVSQAHSFSARLSQAASVVTHQVPLFGPAQLESLFAFLQAQAGGFASASFAVAAGAVSAVIISIYLLYDWHTLHARFARGGPGWRALGKAAEESERALGAWVRGQVLLCAAVGVLSLLALWALGVEFAPVLAALAFVFEFVPYAGPLLAGAPAVMLALNHSGTTALLVIVAYVLIQQLEAHVLVPLIMRRAVDLHPVVIIAALLVGFEVLGLAGMVLAVPVAVVLRIAWRYLWHT